MASLSNVPQEMFCNESVWGKGFSSNFTVNTPSFELPYVRNLHHLTEESLIYYYDIVSPQELSHVTSFLAPKSSQFSLDGNLFSLEMFSVDIRPMLQVIANIIGKEDPK